MEISNYSLRESYQTSVDATKNIDQVMVERIRPLTDRCIIFDSAQLHRVSPQYRGKRFNLASTLWKTKHKRFDVSENLIFPSKKRYTSSSLALIIIVSNNVFFFGI